LSAEYCAWKKRTCLGGPKDYEQKLFGEKNGWEGKKTKDNKMRKGKSGKKICGKKKVVPATSRKDNEHASVKKLGGTKPGREIRKTKEIDPCKTDLTGRDGPQPGGTGKKALQGRGL